jgi:GxxExxY protein
MKKLLCYELNKAGIPYHRQIDIVVPYKETALSGQRLDLLVDGRLILEIKAVDLVHSIHHAKIISYMKSQKIQASLIINFRVSQLRFGIKRFVL